MTRPTMTRRQMVRILGFGSLGSVLAACGAPTVATPTAAPAAPADAPTAGVAADAPTAESAVVATAAPATVAATAELSFLVFETPNLNAEYWDKNIAAVSANIPGLTINKIVSPDADRTKYAK